MKKWHMTVAHLIPINIDCIELNIIVGLFGFNQRYPFHRSCGLTSIFPCLSPDGFLLKIQQHLLKVETNSSAKIQSVRGHKQHLYLPRWPVVVGEPYTSAAVMFSTSSGTLLLGLELLLPVNCLLLAGGVNGAGLPFVMEVGAGPDSSVSVRLRVPLSSMRTEADLVLRWIHCTEKMKSKKKKPERSTKFWLAPLQKHGCLGQQH